jgi:hypothetical protein
MSGYYLIPLNQPNIMNLKINSLAAGMVCLGAWLLAGCAAPNMNPTAAKADTGYVDFYSTNAEELSWSIQNNGTSKTIFSTVDPLEGNVLRLALAPGQYSLGVALLNRLTIPGTVAVTVRDGMVTPVRVGLVPVGSASVSDISRRTYYAKQHWHAVTPSSTQTAYQVEAQAQPPMNYIPREETKYLIKN